MYSTFIQNVLSQYLESISGGVSFKKEQGEFCSSFLKQNKLEMFTK